MRNFAEKITTVGMLLVMIPILSFILLLFFAEKITPFAEMLLSIGFISITLGVCFFSVGLVFSSWKKRADVNSLKRIGTAAEDTNGNFYTVKKIASFALLVLASLFLWAVIT